MDKRIDRIGAEASLIQLEGHLVCSYLVRLVLDGKSPVVRVVA